MIPQRLEARRSYIQHPWGKLGRRHHRSSPIDPWLLLPLVRVPRTLAAAADHGHETLMIPEGRRRRG